MARDWYVRICRSSDHARLKTFCCYTPGEKWTKVPQKMIRDAPDLLMSGDQDVRVLVACPTKWGWRRLRKGEDGRVLGVIVFGAEGAEFVSHAIGVVTDRRREGIGTALKKAALAEFLADSETRVVSSQVHRRNRAMLGLNKKLGAETQRDPEDGELLINVIVAVSPDPGQLSFDGVLGRLIGATRRIVPGPWRPPPRRQERWSLPNWDSVHIVGPIRGPIAYR